MAITDLTEFAHLTEADVEALGRELDAIRQEVEDTRGERDARYIRRTIAFQRSLEIGGRVVLLASHKRLAWWTGGAMLGAAKIIENMEIGHNVIHGQWDWMNDPEVHSANWEWDIVGTSENWKKTHNYIHHKYTNIIGMDDDVGYGLLRVTRDQRWKPFNLGNPAYNLLLCLFFEWGVAIQDLELGKIMAGRTPPEQVREMFSDWGKKVGKQLAKDYVVYPALTGPNFFHTLGANALANIYRNIWTNVVIFCGHFPDGAEKFTRSMYKNETQSEWYLRQMLGSANFDAGPVLAFMSGNLCYQIEHHIFPDLPSNRYKEIAPAVRALCDKYDLPYTTGPFSAQYLQSWRTIFKLALPNEFLSASKDAAPETNSELRFRIREGLRETLSIDPATGKRRGLKTALAETEDEVPGAWASLKYLANALRTGKRPGSDRRPKGSRASKAEKMQTAVPGSHHPKTAHAFPAEEFAD